MSSLKVSVVSYSLSFDPSTLKEWEDKLLGEIQNLAQKSEIILYPELFLAGLGKYFTGSPKEQNVLISEYVHKTLIPKVLKVLNKDILLILGSGPRVQGDKTFNSAPILLDGRCSYQDKLYLTPWETDFTPGTDINVFPFKGLKTSVVICFDSEQPDISLKLKEEGIDLMLVPSATTNKNGSSRVNRCASARAIELGAVVITSPLVGDSIVDLVDHNEGCQGFFFPAQEDVTVDQESFSSYSSKEHVVSEFSIDVDMLKRVKAQSSETKPYHEKIKTHLRIKRI